MTFCALSFIGGWAGCVFFIAFVELAPQIVDRIRRRRRFHLEQAIDPMARPHGDCPWPFRHDELAARPDWVAKFSSHRSGDSA